MRTARLVAILFLSGYLLNGCGGGSAAPPPAATLSVTAPAGSVAAGKPFNVTVSALNASGAVATTYSGTIHFTSSDPQAALPSNSTLTNGTGTFSVTLKTAGSQTITAADTVKPSISGISNSINVSPPIPPPPNGVVGQAYGGEHTITIGGCTLHFGGWPLEELDAAPTGHPWSWSAAPGSSPPPGLAISAVSRSCGVGAIITVSAWLVGGVPTTAGTYNVIVTGPSGSAPYTITITGPGSAAAATKEVSASEHHHYKLVEIGTFGGPNSYFTFGNRTLNHSGVSAGTADTTAYANPPFCLLLPDCFVPHTYILKDEVMTDLGGLPGVPVSGSLPNYINEKGAIAGIAFNGGVDDVAGVPQFDGVVWKDGQIVDLGTFGGPLSYAAAINDRNEAVGFALNTTPSSFDLGDFCQNFPMPTQMHAFIWRDGVKQDLGTLGGTDSCALFLNESGQTAGNSFTNSEVNVSTGLPTLHPFLWDGSLMVDLGSLGGTIAVANGINNRGQVAGASWLAGDQTSHPFLWENGRLSDLGSLGGNFVEVIAFNEVGSVVGKADLPGPQPQRHHAFLARRDGIIDLGTQDGDPCSVAIGINSRDQVAGGSTDCSNFLHAFLWEDGQMIDLNAFVPPSSALTLTQATFINDSGEIAVEAVLPDGDQRAVLLIPCDELHPNIPGCDYSPFDPAMAVQINAPRAITPEEKLKSTEVKGRVRIMPTSRNSMTPRE